VQKSAKSKAEEHFTASKRKDEQDLKDKEIVRRERAEKVAKLRALRLSKEATDKEAAERVDANKAAADNKIVSRRLPQAHRRLT